LECAAGGIAARIGTIARAARYVGTVGDGTRRYSVFATSDSGARILARPLRDGSQEILTVSVAPVGARPPSYLGEADLRELQYDVRMLPLKARVAWHKEPLTQDQINKIYQGRRSHLVYIPVNKEGMPLKVGESTRLNKEPRSGPPRYGKADARKKGFQKYYVGRVVRDGVTVGGRDVLDAQNLIARKLDRMGVRLPKHRRGRKLYTDDGATIVLKSALPRHLQQHLTATAAPQTKAQALEAKRRMAIVRGTTPFELE
jgi:hypothetical protein